MQVRKFPQSPLVDREALPPPPRLPDRQVSPPIFQNLFLIPQSTIINLQSKILSRHHRLRPILQRLREMCRVDLLASCQVRNRPCQLEHLGDTLVRTNSSVPSPRVSSSPPLHPICRTIAPPPPAYPHSRLHYSISCSRIARAVSAEHLQLARVCTLTIPPNGHCSTSDNPPSALPRGYRSGLARDPRSSSGISSPSIPHTYTVCVYPHASHMDSDTHNIPDFSCSVRDIRVFLKAAILHASGYAKPFLSITETY